MGVYTVNQTDGSLVRVAGGMLYADAPIGAIQSYGGETAPAGWLICDGSTVSRTEYAELFAVIGINFGEGDGETTFGIPDLRECVPVGAGKNITRSITNHDRYNLGQFKDDALGTHDHPLKTVTTATYNTAGVPVGVAVNNTPTSATHGKQLGVNYIIKAKQIAVPADIQSAIEAQNSYSTAEIYTGKRWIDGKPIYRKCYVFSTPVNLPTLNDTAVTNYGVSSYAQTLTHLEARMVSADLVEQGLLSTLTDVRAIWGNYPFTKLYSNTGGGSTNYVDTLIFEYTKITD